MPIGEECCARLAASTSSDTVCCATGSSDTTTGRADLLPPIARYQLSRQSDGAGAGFVDLFWRGQVQACSRARASRLVHCSAVPEIPGYSSVKLVQSTFQDSTVSAVKQLPCQRQRGGCGQHRLVDTGQGQHLRWERKSFAGRQIGDRRAGQQQFDMMLEVPATRLGCRLLVRLRYADAPWRRLDLRAAWVNARRAQFAFPTLHRGLLLGQGACGSWTVRRARSLAAGGSRQAETVRAVEFRASPCVLGAPP